MKFRNLAQAAGLEVAAGTGEVEVGRLAAHTSKVGPGAFFVCLPSPSRDTHEFLAQAKESGAVAALCHSADGAEHAGTLGLAAAWAPPEKFNIAAGNLAKAFHNDPSASLQIVGITGTNGKTTTAWMVRAALQALGHESAYLGTLGLVLPSGTRVLENTTPFPIELWELLAEVRDAGCKALAMEVSSHALYERRLAGVGFDVGVFTNLTQDHLDFHHTMQAYEAAKLLLFEECADASDKRFVAALNIDDSTGLRWSERFREAGRSLITFGRAGADLVVTPVKVTVSDVDLSVQYEGESLRARLPVGGLFNVSNAAAALASLLGLGFGLAESTQALQKVRPVPGRFEAVRNNLGFGVLVDYAHTPDALDNLIRSARALHPKRVITVFGCGGDRDKSKRPIMTRTVSRGCDLTILTSDNPRTEDPNAILDDMEHGITAGARVLRIVDRREAIREAIERAEPGDIVLIAGKGHENYQIVGKTKLPMDDRQLARQALEARAR